MDTEVALEERLKHLAMTDPTTGLLNRREAVQHLERLAAERERSGTHIAVLFYPTSRRRGPAAAALPITVAHQDIRTMLSIGVTLLRPGEGVEALITPADAVELRTRRGR